MSVFWVNSDLCVNGESKQSDESGLWAINFIFFFYIKNIFQPDEPESGREKKTDLPDQILG
jgi:hypothetical protein